MSVRIVSCLALVSLIASMIEFRDGTACTLPPNLAPIRNKHRNWLSRSCMMITTPCAICRVRPTAARDKQKLHGGIALGADVAQCPTFRVSYKRCDIVQSYCRLGACRRRCRIRRARIRHNNDCTDCGRCQHNCHHRLFRIRRRGHDARPARIRLPRGCSGPDQRLVLSPARLAYERHIASRRRRAQDTNTVS